MKYQTEYQRNFQKRTPRKVDDYTNVERKLHDVPIRRASSLSPPRHRERSLPASNIRKSNNNFAVIGPNEKFSNSSLYRLRQPIKDNARTQKPREYAILGRNEKLQDNVIYPLRKPVLADSPRIPAKRHDSENHSCGIQTELKNPPRVSFDPHYGREAVPVRSRIGPVSEYQQQFGWKQPLGDLVSDHMLVEDSKVRDRRSDPALPLTVIDPSEKALIEKASVGVNTPARVEIDVERPKPQVTRSATGPISSLQPKREAASEYQARYKPIAIPKKPRTRKAFEAELAEERKRKEIAEAERPYTDDEGAADKLDLEKEFRKSYPYGKLRRWKSEYQTTYKPFWRFDYKDGKWYKDVKADETGFNPNLFWYKELVATRKRADEYRANAEADHFNRDHTLQLKTGYGGAKSYQAWDITGDNETDSVISIDRNAELERQRERELQRKLDERVQSKIHYHQKQPEAPSVPKSDQVAKTDQIAQTDHKTDRVVYIDEPIPRAPSVATKAFVRNLDSTSVQQNMVWDCDSLDTERTNSDLYFKSNTARDLHRKHYATNPFNVARKSSPTKQENQATSTNSSLINDRLTHSNDAIRPATSFQETRHAAGRSTFDTHIIDRRPPVRPFTSMSDAHANRENRYRDDLEDCSYNNYTQSQDFTPASKFSFQNHLNRLDEHFGKTYNARPRDDDVLSINSARSLSSSCSLASQTLERAQQNMNKYWGDQLPNSVHSPKKPCSAKQ